MYKLSKQFFLVHPNFITKIIVMNFIRNSFLICVNFNLIIFFELYQFMCHCAFHAFGIHCCFEISWDLILQFWDYFLLNFYSTCEHSQYIFSQVLSSLLVIYYLCLIFPQIQGVILYFMINPIRFHGGI